MSDHYTLRAMTSTELGLIRSDEQSSELYLAVYKPPVVYSATVNQDFTSLDKIISIVYAGGNGDLADVIPGMTMYVGSAAGLSDIGMCRVRKDPTEDTLYIGENSDIVWARGLFLTIVDDFDIWARHISINDKVPYMDYDIPYSNQHTDTKPIPIIGPRLVPAWIASVADPVNSIQVDITGMAFTGTWYDNYSNETGSTASLTYLGGRIVWYSVYDYNLGASNVYIDGVYITTVSQYSGSQHWGNIFDSGELPPGEHTLTIEVAGSGWIYMNVFRYNPLILSAKVSFDSSMSYCLPDTLISTHLWIAPGSDSLIDPSTTTPDAYYSSPGTYRVKYTVTAANGQITDAYIYVMVFDFDNMPVTQFNLVSCNGSYSERGWKYSIDMWSEADLTSVVDRAHAVLFARDFYGATEISLGQVFNRENILAIGRISGESIIQDPDGSKVTFTVDTPEAWLKRITGFPIGIQDITTAANSWINWHNLTVDASLYHLFLWQSTVIPTIDVFLTGDTKISKEQYAPGGSSIYDQLGPLLTNTILGACGCDHLGRLFCEVDVQLIPVSERSGFIKITDLLSVDWRDQLPMSRAILNSTSQVNLSGVVNASGQKPQAIFSLAPGHVFTTNGKPFKLDRMLLETQAKSNVLAAMKLAWDNHNYEFSPDLSGNNRMLDVFPSHQYVGIVVTENDTPREFVFDGNMIVREISMSWDRSEESPNFLQISWNGENETFPGNSCDGDLPDVSDVPGTNGGSSYPPIPSPPIPAIPQPLPEPLDPETLDNVQVLVPGVGMFYTNNFSEVDSVGNPLSNWYSMNDGIPDPSQVVGFDISSSGRCYCQYNAISIYTAEYPGAPWIELFNNSTIGNPEGYPFPRGQLILGFGIDRDSGELIIVGGVTVTIFGAFLMYLWSGDDSGVALVGTPYFNDASLSGRAYCTAVIGSAIVGKTWAVCVTGDSGKVIYQFAAGSPVASNTTVIGGFGSTIIASRFSPMFITCPNDTVIGNSLDISGDNGASWNNLPSAPDGYLNSVCSNAVGDVILLSGDGVTDLGVRRSLDTGATWEATAIAGTATTIWNLGTDYDWLMAFIGQIIYTPDMGDTYVYKTGDLQTFIGAFGNISHIRFY
jgi:hypothetical protein